jgi:hypothetical protein
MIMVWAGNGVTLDSTHNITGLFSTMRTYLRRGADVPGNVVADR